jgi:beta-galactosidase/beta-glucuronidase
MPYYFHGMLDQGYWSDGIYTPASYKCFIDDILLAKSLGFNTLRKHIKMEPERFYYECDRLGIVVFQDMINNGDYSFIRDTALPTIGLRKLNDKNLHKDKKTREEFKRCSTDIINILKKHPSVCLWTIFNEGWGQFDGNSMYDFVKKLDDTRFIDTASGWFKCENSDVESVHKYFSEYKHKRNKKPVILSEFGGYSYKLDEHSFNLDNTYGYGKIKTKEQFDESLTKLYFEQIIPAIKDGLSSDVYTQLSDVEDETNGLITYDRKVLKVSKETMLKISEALKKEIEKI